MSEKIKSQNLNTSSYPIGIDLGTTNSCVAVWKNGTAQIIPNDKTGKTITPSVVSFTDTKLLIGEEAKERIGQYYKNTIYEAKRIIGRPYDDPTIQMNIKKKRWPFAIKKDPTSESNRSIIETEFMGKKKYFIQKTFQH
jgi:L1 cell adhesion molecule like protein